MPVMTRHIPHKLPASQPRPSDSRPKTRPLQAVGSDGRSSVFNMENYYVIWDFHPQGEHIWRMLENEVMKKTAGYKTE